MILEHKELAILQLLEREVFLSCPQAQVSCTPALLKNCPRAICEQEAAVFKGLLLFQLVSTLCLLTKLGAAGRLSWQPATDHLEKERGRGWIETHRAAGKGLRNLLPLSMHVFAFCLLN